jgi:hypothetical protein
MPFGVVRSPRHLSKLPQKDWHFAQYIVRGLLPMSSDFELFSGIDTEKPLVGNPAVAIIDNDFRRLVGFRQPNRFPGAFPKLLPVEVSGCGSPDQRSGMSAKRRISARSRITIIPLMRSLQPALCQFRSILLTLSRVPPAISPSSCWER